MKQKLKEPYCKEEELLLQVNWPSISRQRI